MDHQILRPRTRVIIKSEAEEPGRDDSLDGGVVGQIQEETDVLHAPVLFEILYKSTQLYQRKDNCPLIETKQT
jgi:hypothetical protein